MYISFNISNYIFPSAVLPLYVCAALIKDTIDTIELMDIRYLREKFHSLLHDYNNFINDTRRGKNHHLKKFIQNMAKGWNVWYLGII